MAHTPHTYSTGDTITAALLNQNETDLAAATNRANHTGTQAASTVTGLSTVATSGAYTDLTAKPTIPTVGAAGAGAAVALSSTDASVTNSRTPTAHTHPASDLTATGTRDATTFLRGDNTWATLAGGGSSSALVPTATKTAAYTAVVGDLAVMNVAGGATALTLPTAPADKAQVGFLAIGATAAAPLTVNRGGATDTLGTASATSVTVPLSNEVTVYQYQAASTRWLAVGNVKPLSQLDARYLKTWAPSTAYAQGDVVSNAGQLYSANNAFTSGATFSGANWTQITGTALTYSARQTDVLRGDGTWDMPNGPASLAYADDFLQGTGTTSYWPWSLTNFGSGSFGSAVSAVDANHPGVVKLTSSTTAGSGGFIGTQSGMFLLGGNEDTTAIFQLPTVTGAVAYFGFFLGNTAAAPTRGVWLNIAGATVTGMAADSVGTATTGTSATITASHWYRARVVAVSATQAAFYLYDCATGALVWSDVVASNAQTTSGLYHSFLAANTGTTAQDILYLDYMSVRVNRALVR